MKGSVFKVAFILLLLSQNIKAQNDKQLLLQLSLNQVDLAYQHKLISPNIWGEAFVGIGNQDINSSFDDFLSGLRIGFNAFSNEKNLLGFNTSIGIYIPNNNYYTATTPVFGAGIRYTRIIGKSGKQSLFVNTGYQYGKQEYKQKYSSEIVNVTTVGTFKIAPLYFSLGYGFKF